MTLKTIKGLNREERANPEEWEGDRQREGERGGEGKTPNLAHAGSLDDRDNQDGRLEVLALPVTGAMGLMILIITLSVLVVAKQWQGLYAA